MIDTPKDGGPTGRSAGTGVSIECITCRHTMYSQPTFTGFVNSGQVVIPVGTRSFTINCVSGSVLVNGTTLLLAGNVISASLPDSKVLLGGPIVLGMSGLANRTTVFYTQ